jgi:hypothetical protein
LASRRASAAPAPTPRGVEVGVREPLYRAARKRPDPALIKERLALPGEPQMLLQLGVARTTQATARRPPEELIEP